jgi:thiamine biosynthesis lipoprotein
MRTLQAAREAMGTRFEILLRGPEEPELRAVAEEALDEITALDRRWSRFREDSEVSDLNRRAAREAVRVSEELMRILLRAEQLRERSAGAFDVGVGSLTRYPSRSTSSQDSGRPHNAGPSLYLAPERREVRFLKQDIQIDLGAIGKGYAIDLAACVCREADVVSGLIHGGTSTVYGLGAGLRGRPWVVGLPWPEAARAQVRAAQFGSAAAEPWLIGRIGLQDQALSLSTRWGAHPRNPPGASSHVIDPRSALPVQGVEMAAVVADSAADADALSTALLVGGEILQNQLAATQPQWRSLIVPSTRPTAQAVLLEGNPMPWQ